MAFLASLLKSLLELLVGEVIEASSGPKVVSVEDSEPHLVEYEESGEDELLSRYSEFLEE